MHHACSKQATSQDGFEGTNYVMALCILCHSLDRATAQSNKPAQTCVCAPKLSTGATEQCIAPYIGSHVEVSFVLHAER